jgi:hypothetical protein
MNEKHQWKSIYVHGLSRHVSLANWARPSPLRQPLTVRGGDETLINVAPDQAKPKCRILRTHAELDIRKFRQIGKHISKRKQTGEAPLLFRAARNVARQRLKAIMERQIDDRIEKLVRPAQLSQESGYRTGDSGASSFYVLGEHEARPIHCNTVSFACSCSKNLIVIAMSIPDPKPTILPKKRPALLQIAYFGPYQQTERLQHTSFATPEYLDSRFSHGHVFECSHLLILIPVFQFLCLHFGTMRLSLISPSCFPLLSAYVLRLL